MLHAFESACSPAYSPGSMEEQYVTHSACSGGKTRVVELSMNESGDGEVFVSSHPSSLTSSGGGGMLSSARPLSKPNKVAHTAGTPEDRDRFPSPPASAGRLRHRSDRSPLMSRSAPSRAASDILPNVPLRHEYHHNSPTVSVSPRSPPPTPLPQVCTLPAVVVTRLPSSGQAQLATASGSRSSSARTPRPTEDVMASHPPSTQNRASAAPSPNFEPIGTSASASPLLEPIGASPSSTHSAASPVDVASPVALASPPVTRSPSKHSLTLSDEADVCCICLDEYGDDNPMFRGACQHHFHLSCLMEWKQRSAACPMCCAETLRGVGELDSSQPTVPVDPAEVARQRAIAERDLAMAQQLQYKYMRQAQRREAHAAHAAHSAHASHTARHAAGGHTSGGHTSGSHTSATRASARVAEVERRNAPVDGTDPVVQPVQLAPIVRVPPSRRPRRRELPAPRAAPAAPAPPAPPAPPTALRPASTPLPNPSTTRARTTPPPASHASSQTGRRSRTKSQAGCCAM